MKTKVSEYITKHNLFTKDDRLLIGISGGRDSISLSLILKDLGYNIALAHCNFRLRGKESDTDEEFVLNFAKQEKIKIFNTHFDTEKIAQKKHMSIQMVARELRYNWFGKIRQENYYQYIAIGHNQDDLVETFFINLIRGTGIEGLTGIKAQNGTIVRPLLGTSRLEIDQYIKRKQIKYREDSSNASTKYIRNKLRHNIIPEFRSIASSFDQTMIANIERLEQAKQVYKNEIESQKQKIMVQFSDTCKINIQKLQALVSPSTYLFEFLKPYGFSAGTIQDIEGALNSESGKRFYSKTHQLIKDRSYLILEKRRESSDKITFFGLEAQEIHDPICLKINIIEKQNFQLSKAKTIASLDLEKLKFPLQIRPWQHGDFFMPLGMNRMKKLSDFFIDNKKSLSEKDNAFVVVSKNDIVWVVGERIDDRYKITDATKKILHLQLDQ